MVKPNYAEVLNEPGAVASRRQAIYWRTLAAMFGQHEQARQLESLAQEIAVEVGVPTMALDPQIAISALVQRFPDLGPELEGLIPPAPDEDEQGQTPPDPLESSEDPATLRRALLLAKLMLNVFGPNANRPTMTASQYQEWTQDVAAFERAFGFQPGQLRGKGGGPGGAGGGAGSHAGAGFELTEEALKRGLSAMEDDLIKRMHLREILKDSKLANKITPSMSLVEQLLRDKSNLSGEALNNAKKLIQRYVDEVAAVLRLQVAQAQVGKIDYSVPPKRVFRNLDLDRTIWKNLINYDPETQRLHVDRLYYKRTATKKMTSRLIIVVDQSGSMVDSMVNCTILASIFAGLPNVDAHLVAYDTREMDLTQWVHDPFEVLLKTQLGGGTAGMCCMETVRSKIASPRDTALVWISDFYDFEDERLFGALKAIHESGVHVIPVGSVTSSGYFSVNAWFKQRFKELGTPLLSGNIKSLIKEIKQFVTIG